MTQLPSRAKMLMRIAIKPGQRSVNPFAPARQEGVSREPAPPARSGTTGHELSLSLVQAHGQQVRFTASKPAPVGHPSPREKCPEKERGLLDRVVVVVWNDRTRRRLAPSPPTRSPFPPRSPSSPQDIQLLVLPQPQRVPRRHHIQGTPRLIPNIFPTPPPRSLLPRLSDDRPLTHSSSPSPLRRSRAATAARTSSTMSPT